jgi:hypothetical protein
MATRRVALHDEDVCREILAAPDDDALWVASADLPATGWEPKPAGLCRGTECVPAPAPRAREVALVRADGAVDLAALARLRGQPVVHDAAGGVWLFDTPAAVRAQVHASLEAPDFALADLEGRSHSLSAFRGRKVLLASWASW